MNIIVGSKGRTDLQVEVARPVLKEPSMFSVVMYNDDFTPMEFVVAVLELFFNMERIIATRVMYEIHMTGKAICGVYSKDVAETKADKVMDHARRHDYPLLCSVEAT